MPDMSKRLQISGSKTKNVGSVLHFECLPHISVDIGIIGMYP